MACIRAVRITGILVAVCVGMWMNGANAAQSFGFDTVVARAKALAAKPYSPPATIPDVLSDLDYKQYQQIRFRPDKNLWRQSHTRFQVMLTAPGEYYRHPVKINIVDASGTHSLAFDKSLFTWPTKKIAAAVPPNLGYAGFKLTFPLNRPGAKDQFLVFAGASYFRGVARHQNFGISGRGIAVDTGLAVGEQFPMFTQFWLVRPRPDAHVMRFYALLDGASLTGAYSFVVYPGQPTRLEVHARLFLRKDIALLGFAPLTSMFYYGANTPRPVGQWRPAVHDSGGLLIHADTGEWLWRPLINPQMLQTDYFEANSPQGFGLIQRHTRFSDYEDDQAHYDKRPSTWVTPHADWGKGHVVLVEIPTDSATNDNIVAFWAPTGKASAGRSYDISYTLDFGDPTIPNEPMARATATYVGTTTQVPADSKAKSAYRVVVDFAGGPSQQLSATTPVDAVVSGLNGTRILQHDVRWVSANQRWRLSLLAAPADGKPLALRAFLKSGKKTLSETWTYALPPKNRFNNG